MSEQQALAALVQGMRESVEENYKRIERLEELLSSNSEAILDAQARLVRVAAENRVLREENKRLKEKLR